MRGELGVDRGSFGVATSRIYSSPRLIDDKSSQQYHGSIVAREHTTARKINSQWRLITYIRHQVFVYPTSVASVLLPLRYASVDPTSICTSNP